MKRDPALRGLSHDHHQALFVAQRLRRATDGTLAEARDGFLDFWRAAGAAHFRIEEEVLLPAFAEHGDAYHPLVLRVLGDHVVLRSLAARVVRAPGPEAATLHRLGADLSEHVRREERELFPLVEDALPADRLAALRAELEAASAG